ncbi:hypothetical protein PAGU2595_020980 [Lysobacter xanthus]
MWLIVAALTGCAHAPAASPMQTRILEASRRGVAQLRAGDAQRARTSFEDALRLAQSVEDEAAMARAWHDLSVAYQRLGQDVEADRALDAVLLDDVHAYPDAEVASIALRKAVLATARGDLGAADAALVRARGACASPCAREGAILNLEARLDLARRRYDDALVRLDAASARNRDDSTEAANTARLRAAALLALRRRDASTAAATQALALDKQLGRSDKIGEDLLLLAEAAPTRDARRAFLLRAADVARARGDAAAEARVRARLEPSPTVPSGAAP